MKNEKPPYELKRKCQNCGVPTPRHMFCPKCDKILVVSYQFEDYLQCPHQRQTFLAGLQRNGVTSVPTLRNEAMNRGPSVGTPNTAMLSLATRVERAIGNFPPELAGEIFRRALSRAEARAGSESVAAKTKQEKSNAAFAAVYEAMEATDTERTKKPTQAERAYAGFDPANSTSLFD